MELPFHLKALPPEALDVLRYYGTRNEPIAHAEEITDGVGLSERIFGKVIRRLVTKGYLQMDGDQAYRLTDQGQDGVDTLLEYDAEMPGGRTEAKSRDEQTVARRLVLVTPHPLTAGSPADIHIGFHPASGGNSLNEPAEMVLRVSVVNGELARPQEAVFELNNRAEYRSFKVTPGAFNRLRIRVQAFQLGPNPDDITVTGGMYVDADVVAAGGGTHAAAYGTDVTLTV